MKIDCLRRTYQVPNVGLIVYHMRSLMLPREKYSNVQGLTSVYIRMTTIATLSKQYVNRSLTVMAGQGRSSQLPSTYQPAQPPPQEGVWLLLPHAYRCLPGST